MREDKILNEFKADLLFFGSELLGKPLAKPHWVFISVSHNCNFNCQMCGVKKVLREQELEAAVIKDVLDQVAAWASDSVVLLTGGEPFLRPDIFELIGHAVSRGLETEVVSNGSLIDGKLAKKIIASGLANIAVSLDGARPETHDLIRGTSGAHGRALLALKNLREEKDRVGRGPQISAWTTIMKENVGELSAIIPLAESLGVECLVYHPVIVCQDDMQNTIAQGHFWITKREIPRLESEIAAIAAYQKEHGRVAFLHDPFMWVDYFQGTLTKNDWTCHPFVFIDVGPDGEVRSCGPSFGNIKRMSLEACLRTPEADRARERMRRCAKPCLQTCWARPDAHSPEAVVKKFLKGIDENVPDDKEKRRLLEKGIELLDGFEERIAREHGAQG